MKINHISPAKMSTELLLLLLGWPACLILQKTTTYTILSSIKLCNLIRKETTGRKSGKQQGVRAPPVMLLVLRPSSSSRCST